MFRSQLLVSSQGTPTAIVTRAHVHVHQSVPKFQFTPIPVDPNYHSNETSQFPSVFAGRSPWFLLELSTKNQVLVGKKRDDTGQFLTAQSFHRQRATRRQMRAAGATLPNLSPGRTAGRKKVGCQSAAIRGIWNEPREGMDFLDGAQGMRG